MRASGTAPPAAKEGDANPPLDSAQETTIGRITSGMENIRRSIEVDQKPIGRRPRSNLATYTGLFDHVRKLFAATPEAKKRR